jgi:hypothetical protein
MEIEFIENKIKNEILNNKFEDWNKNTIDLIISIFEINIYYKYYHIIYITLNDYIKWYQKNDKFKNEIYNLDKLIILRDNIKKDLNITDYYKNLDNNINIIDEEYDYCFINITNITYAIILTLLFIIFKYLLSFIFSCDKYYNNFIERNNSNNILNNNLNNNQNNNTQNNNIKNNTDNLTYDINGCKLSLPNDLLNNPIIKTLIKNFLE